MLKRSILLLSALFISGALAQSDNYYFIQIANDGVVFGGKHPKVVGHKLSYLITIPAEESINGSYSPAAATVEPGQMNSVYISGADANTLLTAHLKVIDLEAGGQIAWEGDVSKDLTTNKIYDVAVNTDYRAYHAVPLITITSYQLHIGVNGQNF